MRDLGRNLAFKEPQLGLLLKLRSAPIGAQPSRGIVPEDALRRDLAGLPGIAHSLNLMVKWGFHKQGAPKWAPKYAMILSLCRAPKKGLDFSNSHMDQGLISLQQDPTAGVINVGSLFVGYWTSYKEL